MGKRVSSRSMPRGRPLASCNFIRGRMQFPMTPTMRRPSRIRILLSFTFRPFLLVPISLIPPPSLSRSPSTVRYCPCNSNSLKRVICIRWDIDDTAMKKALFLQLRHRCSPQRKTEGEREREALALVNALSAKKSTVTKHQGCACTIRLIVFA